MTILLLVMVIANLADCFTTEIALRRGHPEMNPVGRALMKKSRLRAYVIKMLAVAGLAAVAWWSGSEFLMAWFGGLSGAIVVWNLLAMFVIRPRRIRLAAAAGR